MEMTGTETAEGLHRSKAKGIEPARADEASSSGTAGGSSSGAHGTDVITQESQPWEDANQAIRSRIMSQDQLVAEKSIPSYLLKLNAINNAQSQHPSIFKIKGQTNVITTAAIGPYHWKAPGPIITNDKKVSIVRYLIRRQGLDALQFLNWAQDNEERICLCYAKDSIHMKTEDLVEMLLLNGSLVLFAIFHLRSSKREDRRPAYLAKNCPYRKEFLNVSADITYYMKQLRLDMLMLDNQIPFFVVAKLYDQLKTTLFKGVKYGIEEMGLSCFDDIQPGRSSAGSIKTLPETVHHLLHLFHWSRIPSTSKYKVKLENFLPISEPKAHLPSASELRESATLFRRRRSPPGSSLEVSFHRRMGAAVIHIPALYIYDYTESIFRNLIAFEQSHLRCGLSVTAYSICMARLLQSEDDAKILRKNRILRHTQSTNQEIVDFFRKLRDDYKDTFIPMELNELYKDIARHHNSCLGRTCGGIMLQYCPNHWVVISVICAAILFLSTLWNVWHTTYRYYHPVKH